MKMKTAREEFNLVQQWINMMEKRDSQSISMRLLLT